MKTLTITLENEKNLRPVIEVNGQRLKFKRGTGADKRLQARCTVEGNAVALRVSTCHEMAQKHWLAYSMFFWLIGVFGLFCPRYEKHYPTLEFESRFSLMGDTPMHIMFYNFAEGKSAMRIACPVSEIDNPSNRYYYDRKAEKNAKRYRRISRLARLAAIVAGVITAVILIF